LFLSLEFGLNVCALHAWRAATAKWKMLTHYVEARAAITLWFRLSAPTRVGACYNLETYLSSN